MAWIQSQDRVHALPWKKHRSHGTRALRDAQGQSGRMASRSRRASDVDGIQPYRMHVSQRYLDLTKQKLELTRLPREPRYLQSLVTSQVSKSHLEPLIDHWLEGYDWRHEETMMNDSLPQFRAAVNGGTRLHFVHKRSPSQRATPLLFIHGWPESFMAVSKMIDALCDPITTPPRGDEHAMAFHVVAPSAPGFGFSDVLPEEGNNIQITADMLDGLMRSLGYSTYMVHGSGWAFKICRAIALRHPQSCIAIHTVNPEVPPPRAFGYGPEDLTLTGLSIQQPDLGGVALPETPGILQYRVERPQTLSYALTDSPAGLLAYIFDLIKLPSPTSAYQSPPQPDEQNLAGSTLQDPWTPTALITWTMMYWLPGPEVALRWLANSGELERLLWNAYSNVPLGISHFQEPALQTTPLAAARGAASSPAWVEAYHRVVMLRTREGIVRFPAWERPAELVLDMRELAESVIRQRAFGGNVSGPNLSMD